jgi:S-adenosylmethionine:tRNA ribosyltransferase-isomerase
VTPLATTATASASAPDVVTATEPPEARGLARDEVRLLAASRSGIGHHRFRDLPDLLAAGDLLVVNVSATLPAAVPGRRRDGREVGVHVSQPSHGDPHAWVVELRRPDRQGPALDGTAGEVVDLPGGAQLRLRRGDTHTAEGTRLWTADVHLADDDRPTTDAVTAWLRRHGAPIRYGYVPDPWPLDAYQTVFADRPGSAEMPSAGRPFTTGLVTQLVTRGVLLAPIVLHTGVSSLEPGEPPQPERFEVPAATAALVEHVRTTGGRIVAVGTTAVRALESAVGADGRVVARSGWTDLVLGPERPVAVVDGIITGWHDEDASHLELLRAVAGEDVVDAAYAEARDHGYRWHEFGDSCLLLP